MIRQLQPDRNDRNGNFKESPLVEYILVPIGGGGLATGVSTLAKLLNPKIKVIGCELAGKLYAGFSKQEKQRLCRASTRSQTVLR